MGHACPETGQKYYIQATKKGVERAVHLCELSDEEFDKYCSEIIKKLVESFEEVGEFEVY
jgi:hypothetical protein